MLLSSYNITSRSSSSGRQWWMSAGSGLQLKLLNGGIGWTLIPYNSVKELDTKRYKLVNLSVAQKKLMLNGHCSVNIEKEKQTASSILQFKWELHVYLLNQGLSVAMYRMLGKWSNELKSGRISTEISVGEDISYHISVWEWMVRTNPDFSDRNMMSCGHAYSWCIIPILRYNWTISTKELFSP